MSSFSFHTQAKTNQHEGSFEKHSSGFYLPDNRTRAAVQRKEKGFIDNRPQTALQKKQRETLANKSIQRKANATGLPDNLKTGIENLSGYSMDDVKVHYNSSQPAQLNAHAYAQGTNIHIASGQEKHLPHEAWHVVQQKQGRVKPTMQMKGKVNINDDDTLEREADIMGKKADSYKGVLQRKLNALSFFNGIVQRVTKIKYFSRDFDYINSKGDAEKEVVGINMNADLDPGDPIKGSEPGDGVQFGIMSSLKNNGIKRMIRGHLMNGQMGGLGIAANLFPITAHANSKHKSFMENYVKGQLYEENKQVHPRHIYYNVQVVPQSPPQAKGWSPIDVDFVCSADNGGGGWKRNVTIESRPTKNVKNLGNEGGPSKNPDLKGRAEGKSPASWGQAGDGYSSKDPDHQNTLTKSIFDYKGHALKPDLELYTSGMHFNKGGIDVEKLKAFELFWKLEEKVGNVKLKGKILTESDIEKMGSADLQLLIPLLKQELDNAGKVSKGLIAKAKAYAKEEPKKTALASAAVLGGGAMLFTSYFWTGGITLGASALAWYLHDKGYI